MSELKHSPKKKPGKSVTKGGVKGPSTVKHGLCARELHLENADEQEEFQALIEELSWTLSIVGTAQKKAVERLACAWWRQSVLDRLEQNLLDAMARGDRKKLAGMPNIRTLCSYRSRLARDSQEALDTISELQAGRAKAFQKIADRQNRAAQKHIAQKIYDIFGSQLEAATRDVQNYVAGNHKPKLVGPVDKGTSSDSEENKDQE